MTLTEQLYNSLRAYPCRCQMQGGERWHVQAQTVPVKKCSRCLAIERYEAEYILELDTL